MIALRALLLMAAAGLVCMIVLAGTLAYLVVGWTLIIEMRF